MEYLDTTARTSGNALASRLAQESPSEHDHLRIKTGYFALNGLGGLKSSLDHLVQNDLPITIALGANDKATIKDDVDALFILLGCPRPNAKLCVISCLGGLFHPKVVHLTRTDGSQLAYVGSANVTPAGFNGANIEAGILLDSRTGDPAGVLSQIAASIDDWFAGPKPGVTLIAGVGTTEQLVADGVLGLVRQPSSNTSTGSAQGSGPGPRMPLAPLVAFPPLVGTKAGQANSSPANASQVGAAPAQPTSSPANANVILIAEIGAGVRWKQANFPFAIMRDYFRVNPVGNGSINLLPVAANGAVSPPAATQVVNVKSQNYRLELASVSGTPYPTNGRPIAVFRNTGPGNFRYRVFLPGDSGYASLSTGLIQRYTGPAQQLARIVVDSATLQVIWSGCPV